jgi:hypothetical protein
MFSLRDRILTERHRGQAGSVEEIAAIWIVPPCVPDRGGHGPLGMADEHGFAVQFGVGPYVVLVLASDGEQAERPFLGVKSGGVGKADLNGATFLIERQLMNGCRKSDQSS